MATRFTCPFTRAYRQLVIRKKAGVMQPVLRSMPVSNQLPLPESGLPPMACVGRALSFWMNPARRIGYSGPANYGKLNTSASTSHPLVRTVCAGLLGRGNRLSNTAYCAVRAIGLLAVVFRTAFRDRAICSYRAALYPRLCTIHMAPPKVKLNAKRLERWQVIGRLQFASRKLPLTKGGNGSARSLDGDNPVAGRVRPRAGTRVSGMTATNQPFCAGVSYPSY
jgi:hypothetical protein